MGIKPKPIRAGSTKFYGGPARFQSAGFPIYSEGRTIPKWPYRECELIGYRLLEYRRAGLPDFRGGGNSTPHRYHVWRYVAGAMHYVGACREIEACNGLLRRDPKIAPKRQRASV